jgi:hypothetical protein
MMKTYQINYNNLSEFQKAGIHYSKRTDNIYKNTSLNKKYQIQKARYQNNYTPSYTNNNWSTPHSMPSPGPSVASIQATSTPCRSLGAIPF